MFVTYIVLVIILNIEDAKEEHWSQVEGEVCKKPDKPVNSHRLSWMSHTSGLMKLVFRSNTFYRFSPSSPLVLSIRTECGGNPANRELGVSGFTSFSARDSFKSGNVRFSVSTSEKRNEKGSERGGRG